MPLTEKLPPDPVTAPGVGDVPSPQLTVAEKLPAGAEVSDLYAVARLRHSAPRVLPSSEQ